MSRILLFAGTSEGRNLSQWLCEKNTDHELCVATEYGEKVLNDHPCAHVFRGRMDENQIVNFMKEQGSQVVVDATHPYAQVVTENIKNAAAKAGVTYLRLDRNTENEEENDLIPVRHFFEDAAECAQALAKTEGNILLTTGSKELYIYCQDSSVKERLVVRVLPGSESIAICEKNEIPGKRIIAMQGPFSLEMNRALIHDFDIKVMVSKLSGKAGGYFEKEQAAALENVTMYLIGRPDNSKGLSSGQVKAELEKYLNKAARKITLIGCGMGNRETMTMAAVSALDKAEIVFGAKRLIESAASGKEAYPYYLAKDIIPVLKQTDKDAVILFSGDTGFYSGAAKMYQALKEDTELKGDIQILPGISSVSNLSALSGVKWDDAKIFSAHGKGDFSCWKDHFLAAVKTNGKTFMLLSGVKDLNNIGEALIQNGLDDCRVVMGYQMSYPEQELLELTPSQCTERDKEGLYALFIINQAPQSLPVTHGLPDSQFIRDKVPMTKEEVREASISKLQLKADSVVYDIGSGTGSIAVEIARLSPDIKVYAIERKPEAVALIKENAKKFALSNIEVIEAYAPEGLENLPAPTHAFIGGSGGNMMEILKALFEKNSQVRICANAVSFETLEELLQIEKNFEVEDFDIISMSVTRTRVLGSYHMMQAENPIWICSFKGK